MILTKGATFVDGVGVGIVVIVTLNSLVAVAPSLSVTSTCNISSVSTFTTGAIKLTLRVSSPVKVTSGPDIIDQLTDAILPSASLAFAVSSTIPNSWKAFFPVILTEGVTFGVGVGVGDGVGVGVGEGVGVGVPPPPPQDTILKTDKATKLYLNTYYPYIDTSGNHSKPEEFLLDRFYVFYLYNSRRCRQLKLGE
ncbi:hypothetical protein [uncultured Paraglaciecola sp.]|uniref:hypothetical protein n=1 Tax=uncultured Paraglaciecola sp. TaxID=1765024 RepID=UPI0030DBD971